MIKTISRGALALLGTLALSACGSSQSTSPSTASVPSRTTAAGRPPSSSARTPCTDSELKFTYAGTQGATGHLELMVSLRNVSARRCTLRGYASARLLNAAGQTLGVRVRRGGGFFPDSRRGPRLVMLAPGGRALYGLSFANNTEYAGARVCRSVTALMSRVPGGSAWARLTLSGGVRPRIAPCGSSVVLSPIYAAARPPA